MKTGKKSILITLLPLLSILAAVLPGIIGKVSAVEVAKLGVLTLILSTIASLYIRMNEEDILSIKFAATIIILGYLSSICLLLFIPESYLFCFWMTGVLLISMLIDHKLGLLLHFILSFMLGVAYPNKPEIIIQFLITGIMIYILSGALRSKSTVVYASIIILSTNITLSFVINNFIINQQENYNYLYSMFSTLLVLMLAYLISWIYDKVVPQVPTELLMAQEVAAGESHAALTEASVEVQTDDSSIQSEDSLIGTHSSYEILCSKENELLARLRENSDLLYSHCLKIADLSKGAAKAVGADEQLAMAGGLYHEIGKINGKNYIEEGLLIAEAYAFPKELKAILKEHNIKYDKPGSIEAAIVMLSDNVVSTIEYIDKTGDRKFTPAKIIDNIFQMRMDKGTFDRINLSLKDFKVLKEFYQMQFNEKVSGV